MTEGDADVWRVRIVLDVASGSRLLALPITWRRPPVVGSSAPFRAMGPSYAGIEMSTHQVGRPMDARAMWEEDVRRARAMQPADRLVQALELSDFARALMVVGLRSEDPLADERVLAARLHERLAIVRRFEVRG